MIRFKYFVIASFISASSCANDTLLQIPADATERFISANLNLSTEQFYSAYMSTDHSERRLAEMYLVGVIDATEGKTWCDYERVSASAIQEQVLAGLKLSIENGKNIRASAAITSKLEALLPCQNQE